MKALKKLVLISLGLLGSIGASASTIEQAYLQACRKEPGVPIPLKVVSPSVGAEYVGSTVDLEFVVDASGKPEGVSVKSDTDYALAAAVTDAVKQWSFKPAEREGAPVATRVRLPVRIVNASDDLTVVAAN